jgi:threonyl-tRNA synthetase
MSNQNIETIRHSLSHIMAQAVKELYPDIKFGIGPAIDTGFYYDFDNLKISDDDLAKIEERMVEMIEKNIKFTRKDITKKEAKKMFAGQPYKLELIEDVIAAVG